MGLQFGIFGGFEVVCSSVRRGSKFVFSGFGPGFGPFLAKQVQSSGFLEGFEWVRSSVLRDEPGFE